MLFVEGLAVDLGGISILRNVAMRVEAGEMIGLIGRNGAGKTTFMRAVMGLLPSRAQRVEFSGVDMRGLPAYERARLGIGFMPEDRRLVPDFTAEDNILLPAWSGPVQDVEERLAWIFGLMPEVREFRQRRANQLSGGQQKMVALARALLAGQKLLLLDEPFEGLAPAIARRLAEVLAGLRTSGLAVIMADSGGQHVAGLISRQYGIERGEVVEMHDVADAGLLPLAMSSDGMAV